MASRRGMSAPVMAGLLELRIPLILGSRSPRRVELLQSVGISPRLGAADVDETALVAEAPTAYVDRIARAKLSAAERSVLRDAAGPLAVLVADTTVTVDGDILGKPNDAEHAREMLQRLQGRTHEVLTCYGIGLVGAEVGVGAEVAAGSARVVRTVATRVSIRRCSAEELARYVASGEPFGKAGAYAIQGLGAVFVERIEGSYTGVVGLPLSEVVVDLARMGIVGPGA